MTIPKQNRKFWVYLINTVVLVATLAGAMFYLKDINLIQWILGGVLANGATYITGNAVVNYQKSKHYHPEMDHDNASSRNSNS